jgi:hypothetical protein
MPTSRLPLTAEPTQTGKLADRHKVSPYRLRSMAVGWISQIRTMDTIYLPAAYLPAAMASCIWPR